MVKSDKVVSLKNYKKKKTKEKICIKIIRSIIGEPDGVRVFDIIWLIIIVVMLITWIVMYFL